jgi:hypothetical protein
MPACGVSNSNNGAPLTSPPPLLLLLPIPTFVAVVIGVAGVSDGVGEVVNDRVCRVVLHR